MVVDTPYVGSSFLTTYYPHFFIFQAHSVSASEKGSEDPDSLPSGSSDQRRRPL